MSSLFLEIESENGMLSGTLEEILALCRKFSGSIVENVFLWSLEGASISKLCLKLCPMFYVLSAV